MNIAIFGANGATGQLLTQYALSAEHQVTVLTRELSPLRIAASLSGGPLKIVRGSVFDLAPVLETLQGVDAVFSALGAHSPFRNENVLPRAVPVIVEAMQQAGVRRIIALGSAGALPTAFDKQPVWQRWIVHRILYRYVMKWPVYEQVEQHRILSNSILDWTMVLPPMLTHGAERGRYRVDGETLPYYSISISRADVARFMIQQLTSTDWLRRGVFVSN